MFHCFGVSHFLKPAFVDECIPFLEGSFTETSLGPYLWVSELAKFSHNSMINNGMIVSYFRQILLHTTLLMACSPLSSPVMVFAQDSATSMLEKADSKKA